VYGSGRPSISAISACLYMSDFRNRAKLSCFISKYIYKQLTPPTISIHKMIPKINHYPLLSVFAFNEELTTAQVTLVLKICLKHHAHFNTTQ